MKKGRAYKILILLLVIPVFLFYTGCSSSWVPSNEEAIQLVKDHYLFFYGGKEVEASVIERGSYMDECKCYPIKFKIIISNHSDNTKTFYFYKDGFGEGDLKSYYG